MANPASTADIESRWRSLTAAELPVAETRLEDAWRKLRRDVAGIEARFLAEDDLEADAVQVLADAVIRVLQANERNGLRRGSVTIDDRSRSWEVDESVRADLYFTEAELASLIPASGESKPRAYSVMPS